MADSTASLFNLVFCLGGAIGSFYGQFMTTAIGYRGTADVLACMTFTFAIVYAFFGGLCEEVKGLCSKNSEDDDDSYQASK